MRKSLRVHTGTWDTSSYKKYRVFIFSFTEPEKLHTLSNPFYLCYCNNKLPGETQCCSLATLAFQRILFHHCKKIKKVPLGYLGTNLGLPCTMVKAREKLAHHHCHNSEHMQKGTNSTGFGHTLQPKPKPAHSYFYNLTSWKFLFVIN